MRVRNLLHVLFCFIVLTSLVKAQEITRKSVDVPEVNVGSIKIDGRMDEMQWQSAARANIINSTSSEGFFNKYYSIGDALTRPDYHEITGRMLWSRDTLYLFYHVHEFVNDSMRLYFRGKWVADQIMVGLSSHLDVELKGWYDGNVYAAPEGPYYYQIFGTEVTLNGGDSTSIPSEYRKNPNVSIDVFRASDICRWAAFVDTTQGIWDIEMAIYNPGVKAQSFIGFNLAGSNGGPRPMDSEGSDHTYCYYTWQPCIPNDPYGDPIGVGDPGRYIFVSSKYWTKLNFIPKSGPGSVWELPISIKDNSNSITRILALGVSPLATDGMDKAFDEQPLPPLPPQGAFDVRFKLPVTPADYSLKDYRSDTLKAVTWTMLFQPGAGGYPMTFSWNPSLLPQEGSFFLKDVINGSIVNVDMKTQSSFTLPNEDINTLKIEYKKQITKDVSLSTGWNIISVPVLLPDMNTQVLFAGYTSPTYSYLNGYQTANTLETSKGYWIRYGKNANVSLTGSQVISTTVPILTGWNLIGVYDKNIAVNSLSTTPSGILNSPFYGYKSGYYTSDSLNPGKGYWIRASQNGVINLNYSNTQTAKTNLMADLKDSWGKIIIEDNSGSRGVLFISDMNENSLSDFDLPPVPPMGVFDVRYSTDRLLESQLATLNISSAEYPVKISSEGMDLRVKDILNGSSLNVVLKNGQSLTITNSSLDKLMVERISQSVQFSYELQQNYPNPFNPSTRINYSIAENRFVTIKMYNILGKEIEILVNEFKPAGSYSVEFNARNLPSGIYFYAIKAGEYTKTMKMTVMK